MRSVFEQDGKHRRVFQLHVDQINVVARNLRVRHPNYTISVNGFGPLHVALVIADAKAQVNFFGMWRAEATHIESVVQRPNDPGLATRRTGGNDGTDDARTGRDKSDKNHIAHS